LGGGVWGGGGGGARGLSLGARAEATCLGWLWAALQTAPGGDGAPLCTHTPAPRHLAGWGP
jgi:hypothetical protein